MAALEAGAPLSPAGGVVASVEGAAGGAGSGSGREHAIRPSYYTNDGSMDPSMVQKGGIYWYFDGRDGVEKEVTVVSIDRSLDLPSFLIRFGACQRETEAHRLFSTLDALAKSRIQSGAEDPEEFSHPRAHFLKTHGSVYEPIHCAHPSACLPPL